MPKRLHVTVLAISAVALLAPIGAAMAGVEIKMERTGDPMGGALGAQGSAAAAAPHESHLFLDPDRMKMTFARGGVIFIGGEQKMMNYDDTRKSYMEITQQTMQAMHSQMGAQMGAHAGAQAEAMQKLQEQMKNMPEAQRKMMEQALAQRGVPVPGAAPAAPPSPPTFTKIAGGVRVERWTCDEYERAVDGKRTDVYCLARLSDLGLTKADIKVFDDMSQFSKALSTGAPGMAGRADAFDMTAINRAVGYDALPIRTTHFTDGQQTMQTVVKAIDRKTLPAETFEVPAGYTKRVMGMPGAN